MWYFSYQIEMRILYENEPEMTVRPTRDIIRYKVCPRICPSLNIPQKLFLWKCIAIRSSYRNCLNVVQIFEFSNWNMWENAVVIILAWIPFCRRWSPPVKMVRSSSGWWTLDRKWSSSTVDTRTLRSPRWLRMWAPTDSSRAAPTAPSKWADNISEFFFVIFVFLCHCSRNDIKPVCISVRPSVCSNYFWAVRIEIRWVDNTYQNMQA